MSRLLRDVWLAFRQLRKNRGFAAGAAGTLALGIGATTAIFSLVDAVMLRPLPFPQPDRLVWVRNVDHTAGLPPNTPEELSYPDYFDWRAQARSFDGLASYRTHSFTLSGSGQPQVVPAAIVSANFFRVLGVQPALGRDFLAEEETPGSRVAILSHQFWQAACGAAPDIAGRTITLDGRSYTVAGVMPPGRGFPISNPAPALWISLARDGEGPGRSLASQRGADVLDVVGRLKPAATVDSARAELDLIARRLAAQYPDTNETYTSTLAQPLLEHLVGDYRPALRALFAAVACLLLIACANVAGLLLVNGSRRASEIALRVALGAGRGEVARQILVESLVLALAGGALGVVFSSSILDLLLRFVPAGIPRLDQIVIDRSVLAFATAVSVITGVLFGLAPAWRASRLDPVSALRDGGRGTTPGRGAGSLHNWTVISQTAICLVLLVGAGLLIRSFVNVLQVNPGFDPAHVLTASIDVPSATYSTAQRVAFYDGLLPRLAALPGVRSAAAGYPLPLAEGSLGISFAIEGRPTTPGGAPSEVMAVATPGFFHTMGIPVLAGREFDARDNKQGRPVIVVNQRFARKYFPGESALGKHVRSDVSDGDAPPPMREIVGVVGDVHRKKLVAEPEPMYYLPFAQVVITSPALCLRAAGDPEQLAGALREEVARLNPEIPVFRVRSMDSLVSNAASEPRFQVVLVTSFALLAMVLSAVGLYAVLSYMVVRRTMEIGLRMALGAARGDVLRWVLRRGLAMAGLGVAIGLAASVAVTRYLQQLLFGVKPLDVLTLAVVSAVLLAVAALASGLPALRAARLDPLQALRQQ